MKPWDQVQVIAEGSDFNGRAGVIQSVDNADPQTAVVKLDESPEHEEEEETFLVSDLKLLGHG